MLRQLHSIPGLVFGLILIVLSLTGAFLALDPAIERANSPRSAVTQMNVAQLADVVHARFPTAERIDRRANGAVIVSYDTGEQFADVQIDPPTGEVITVQEPSPVMEFVKSLHRSFFLGDAGRAVAGVTAGTMILLGLSGLFLLAASLGGWRKLARPVRGSGAGRLHATVGRFAVVFLLFSALTGLYMSLANFGFVNDGQAQAPEFPFEVATTAPTPIGDLAGLKDVRLDDLRRLTFPQPDDPADVFGLQTAGGSGFVDQSTGAVLNWMPSTTARQVWETIYMLHTGQGLWWLGLILGAAALAMPVMTVTGTLVWWRRRSSVPRFEANAKAAVADTVILVGSEGGSTWGFAGTLHRTLTEAGCNVHTAPMNSLRDYPRADRLFILTATYGDGAAPSSATAFLDRMTKLAPSRAAVAVLGFGDRMFPKFCGYAEKVDAAMVAAGYEFILPLMAIDRQSAIDFAAWGKALGEALGGEIILDHRATVPATQEMKLVSREDFGEQVQAPTAILRFGPAKPVRGLRRLFGRGIPRFESGDLIGIVPPGSHLPRFYSIASSSSDGMLEICVRKSPGGLCSGHLHSLIPGDTIQAFVKPNPQFRPIAGRAPVILVAAGCGIGPMAGFLRQNRNKRAMELYFGARDPNSDFLYGQQLSKWQGDGRLSRLVTAFSRVGHRVYVQEMIRRDASRLQAAIAKGGQVMVCGSFNMARAVMAEVEHAIAPLGLTVETLKMEGRYVEDVY